MTMTITFTYQVNACMFIFPVFIGDMSHMFRLDYSVNKNKTPD